MELAYWQVCRHATGRLSLKEKRKKKEAFSPEKV